MNKTEQQIYNLVLKETKKQIILNEAFFPPRALTKIGKKIFSFAKRVRTPEFSVSKLGVEDSFANIMKRRLNYLDDSLDDILSRSLLKRDTMDWDISTKNLKRNLEKVGTEIERKIANIKDEVNIYRTADPQHPKISDLQKNIDELDDMKSTIDNGVDVVARGTPENIIDMANTIKSGKMSHAGKRAFRKPEQPTTPRQPEGQPGTPGPQGTGRGGVAPVPAAAAKEPGLFRKFLSSNFTILGITGYATMYYMSDYIEKAGYPLIAKFFKLNIAGLAVGIVEYGPAIVEALTDLAGIGKAADAKRTLENVETAKGWIEELVLLKLIENNKDLSPPEGQKYTDKLQTTYLTVNEWSVDKRETFLNQVDEVTKNIAVNREALEALADANNPVIDGIFHASMALYISKKTFTNHLGDKGKIRVDPDPKKGFTRISNCNAIKKADIDLNKLEKSLPNDTDLRAFANYCDLVGYKPSSKDKATLVAYVMKGFTEQAKQAGAEVRSDLHANVKKD